MASLHFVDARRKVRPMSYGDYRGGSPEETAWADGEGKEQTMAGEKMEGGRKGGGGGTGGRV